MLLQNAENLQMQPGVKQHEGAAAAAPLVFGRNFLKDASDQHRKQINKKKGRLKAQERMIVRIQRRGCECCRSSGPGWRADLRL